MPAAPLPPNEDERLAALGSLHVLDTPPEAVFDNLTALAAYICDAPIALVSLVDRTRQWFKSAYGIDLDETPRDVSLCAHGILVPDEPLVIEDVTRDPRFADSPLVGGPAGIAAYAGWPLRLSDGIALGMLCVADLRARAFSRAQVRALEQLSQIAARQLTLRRALVELEQEGARREASEAMNRRFAALLEDSPDLVGLADVSGRPMYLNAAGRRICGIAPGAELLGSIASVHGPEARTLLEEVALPAAFEHGRWMGETAFRGADGREIPVSQLIVVHRDDAGSPEFVATIARDVTERKRMEASLVEAREAALAASRLKSEFLANMSHEIRTPLNGITGLSGLLLRTELTPDQRQHAEGIAESAEALLAIVNDILDLSKIEAGRMRIERVPVELPAIVEQSTAPARVKAAAKGLEIRIELRPDALRTVLADPVRLRQVLLNLIDNAVKFTERGAVDVSVEPAAGGVTRFEVRDSGIGIPSDKQALIFDKFMQADGSTTRRFGGSGLGLAICRQLVELMGGTIGVESTEGRGTTFWFELPLASATSPRALNARPAPAVARRPLRILLAEDNRINQRVAARLLELAGHSVDVVENGGAAVERAASGGYDAIFMDCQMPVMDGYEATRRIRELQGLPCLPIVALTAHAMRGDRERCADAGMTDYLAKPIEPAELHAVLDRIAAPSCGSCLQLERTLRTVGGGAEDARELSALALAEIDAAVAGLQDAVDRNAMAEAARCCHKLRGTLANVACANSVLTLTAVEHAARAGNRESLQRLLGDARVIMARVREELAIVAGASGRAGAMREA